MAWSMRGDEGGGWSVGSRVVGVFLKNTLMGELFLSRS